MPELSPAAQAVQHRSGIPAVGLGTYGRTGAEGEAAILSAIEAGYRHLDTAQNYDSEGGVGTAIRRSGLERSAFFVTTKVGDARLDRAQFLPSVERSLDTLGTGPVDLLLVHWPSQNDRVPMEEYILALAEARERGWTRLIGVSNFPVGHLRRADAILGPGQLATDQVELHPYLQSPRLRDHARATRLTLTAYRPLAHGRVSDDPVLQDIARQHDATPAAVALAFLIAEGHVVIPASAHPERQAANLRAASLDLSAAEVGRIHALDRGERIINPDKSPPWDD